MSETPRTAVPSLPSEPTPAVETSTQPPTGPAATTQPPTDPAADPVLDTMRQVGLGTLADRMGIELLEVGPQRTVARMPVAGNTQPYGLLHGGASAVLAETIGSIASALHAAPDRIALGLELSCTHHRALREGVVTGTAVPLVLGRTVASYDIRIVDEQQRPVCTARLTCLLREA